jgi:phage tail tape-measure protein
MFFGNSEVITLLYGMAKPDPKAQKDHMKKVAKIVAAMGDKYLLAKPIDRKDANS